MEAPQDEWDDYEILVDSINDVDLTSLGSSLPADMVAEVIKSSGSNVGNVQTFLTSQGYEMRIEPIELDPIEKMIREEDGKFTVYDSSGRRKFGTYPSKEKAEERLAQIERFSKADNTPPKAVRTAARRALDWIGEGKAGGGFTSVGRARASQLASGESVSLETLKRMKSFFSRHEVDKNALGFSQGEKGYPSPGRVAWDAWGGDAGFAWAESMVARAEREEEVAKHNPGKHDQKTHGSWADGIADAIFAGKHPTVEKENVSAFLMSASKRTDHPDLTELSIEGTLLYGDEGMGIARKDMPQIPGKERARFLTEIAKGQGVTSTAEEIDPTTLKPIQKEISAARSGAIFNKFREDGAIPQDERILISKDGFVVDGHHTWGAAVAFAFDNPGTKLPVYRLSVTAQEALDISLKWAADNGFEGQAIDAPAKKSLLWEPLEKHGEHDQRTHGSWANNMVSDKEPEQGQSKEAIALARGVRERAVAAEPAITKLVQAVADQSGAKLEGLSERIKSTDSLSRKIDQDAEKEYQGDRNKAAEEISDANRYTISVNDNDYADTLKSTVSAFEETGWKVRVKNFWQSGDPYDGVNVKAERDGIKVEVQVHTPKSYQVKEKALHDVYEVYRKSTDDSVRESTWNKMVGIAKRVPRPSNYTTVLGVGTLILQQFETAQQAGLIKSTPVGKLSHERRA
jgi:predicted RNA-binding protein